MLYQASPYAIAIWLAAGAFCGWLEARRVDAHGAWLGLNILIAVLGAIAAGIFFKWIGELGPPWQGPIYSGFIGAAIALVVVSPLLRRLRARPD